MAQSALPSLANPPHDGRPAHAVSLSNLCQGHAAKPVSNDGLVVNVEGLATDWEPLQFPSPDSGPDSFLNQFGFEFSD